MFLFSTQQSSPTPQPADPVVSAIREGAEKTGAGFDYLLKTAQRESSLEPDAKAKTSSATGLFQFIEQTWLSMVKQEGPKQGLGDYASAISEGDNGKLTVADPAAREKIMKLRTDPQVAAVMAGAFTQKNRDQLAASLGRQPQAGELYMAHVLGARGASDLIQSAQSDPTRIAAKDFPDAAAANRGLFYDKAGRARSAQEVYGVLAASHANTQLAAATTATASTASGKAATTATEKPIEIAAALQPGRAKGLIGLFSTEGSRGPVSNAVANIWTTPRQGGTRLASLDDGNRYFPRQTQSDATATAPAAATDAAVASTPARAVTAPLPPSRPVSLTQPTSSATATAQTTTQAGGTPVRPKTRRTPLDLSSFMVQRGGA
jgi:hypothetical protein